MKTTSVLITSSDNFTSQQIEKHHGLVDAQIVIGANIFRDVFSGFRDIFGGETKGYQKDIDKMKSGAFSRLKSKAREQGANAVISTRIDLDEVSGGGKSMFMLNVYGSAVKLEDSALQSAEDSNILEEITHDDLEFHVRRNRIKNRIFDADDILAETTISVITELDLWTPILVKKVVDQIAHKSTKRSYDQLIENLDHLPSVSASYLLENYAEKIKPSQIFYSELIGELEKIDWYDGTVIKKLLNSKNHIKKCRGLRLSVINNYTYDKQKANQFEQIATFIRENFDSTIPTKKKDKMIGSKKVFTCPRCLRERDLDKPQCECGANRFGFKKDNTPSSIVNFLKQRAQAIQAALDYQS